MASRMNLTTMQSALIVGTLLHVGTAEPVLAQAAIERHPVPVETPSGPALRLNQPSYSSDDARPYGVDLTGVLILGETDAVSPQPPRGIAPAAAPLPTGAASDVSGIHAALRQVLANSVGQPLSPKVVAMLQAAVASVYRTRGFPFVSVTVPPQEITSGVVQLRVILFRTGRIGVSVTGDAATGEADKNNVLSGVRQTLGETIDARRLSEDIDWLNRTPYRHVTGTFSPGEATALSNLTLELSADKPWSIESGWSNSGSTATGIDRYSLGAGVFLPGLAGATASYLVTGDTKYWADPGLIRLEPGEYPRYLSQSARIVVPTFGRQQLEFAPDVVTQRQVVDANTTVENSVVELPIIYRSAVSNLFPGTYWGNIYGGVELKYLERRIYFVGMEFVRGDAELMQLAFGWSNTITDPLGQTAFDVKLEVSPGNTLAYSSNAAWSSYTNGRVTRSDYAYSIVNINRHTDLPVSFAWVSGLTAVIAGTALPDTERLSLGGSAGSRAYSFSDVSVDRGAVWRNELRLPPIASQRAVKSLPIDLVLAPYLFADAAWGQDIATRKTYWLTSLGSGLDLSLANHVTGGVTLGRAMTATPTAPVGSWTLLASVSVKF